MSARELIDLMTVTDDQSNLCVILRPGEIGLEALLVADEKGRWSIPGGHAKEGESRADACKREVKEETGLDVEPQTLFLAAHAARKLPVTLYYATVEPGTEGRPGGGDVTDVRWVNVTNLGNLNGTDKLAIQIAANRVHNPQALVDDEVELAEQLGFAVANVAAPPTSTNGMYLRLNGKACTEFATRLSEWLTDLGWPVTVIDSALLESTKSALARASSRRRLTPMLECLLHVSDTLWRYESAVAPALAKTHIVIETGPEIEHQRFLDRGLEPELWETLNARIPKPTMLFTVGDRFDSDTFQALKDSIEPDDQK